MAEASAPVWDRYVSTGVAWARQVEHEERIVCTYGVVTAFTGDWVVQQTIGDLTNTFVLQDIDFTECWVKPANAVREDGQSTSGTDPHPAPGESSNPAPVVEPQTPEAPAPVDPTPPPAPESAPAPVEPAPAADTVNPAPAQEVPVPAALVDATQPVVDAIPEKVKEVPNPVS